MHISRTPTPTSSPTATPTPAGEVIVFPSPAKGNARWFYYAVQKAARIRIEVYNAAGERCAVIKDRADAAGHHRTPWDITTLAPGIYLYRLSAEAEYKRRDDFGLRKFVVVK